MKNVMLRALGAVAIGVPTALLPTWISSVYAQVLVISDTSWPGYVDTPAHVIEGYATIFTEVANGMTIAREEIFGPVLAVIRCESTDQAIRIANDTEYGLSAGVWSTDNLRALDVAGQLEAGTVWVNDWHMVNAAYPFGGYKQSGFGRELGPHALDEYTEEKFVHVDLSGRLDRRAYPLLLGTPPA